MAETKRWKDLRRLLDGAQELPANHEQVPPELKIFLTRVLTDSNSSNTTTDTDKLSDKLVLLVAMQHPLLVYGTFRQLPMDLAVIAVQILPAENLVDLQCMMALTFASLANPSLVDRLRAKLGDSILATIGRRLRFLARPSGGSAGDPGVPKPVPQRRGGRGLRNYLGALLKDKTTGVKTKS